MIRKIDINSNEFKEELEKTKEFTNGVLKLYELVYNPDKEVNESIQMGLTRNSLIYGKRYCPCFMVIEETETEKNRLCPCMPALTKEIPLNGSCHCGIFCTKDKAKELAKENNLEDALINHSRGLLKEECEDLLRQVEINSLELEALLEARKLGIIEFNLVDTREWMEWVSARIVGTDYLVPTTSFYHAINKLEDKKDIPVVVYCHSGSRSAYCQRVMLDLGFKSVTNLDYGITSFQGEKESGDN
ncbi:ferredoxin-thioredoxin reductase catalytic domain-containing protein [Aliarcobacter butzleri]